MQNLLEIIEKINTGPFCREQEFDLDHLNQTIRELIKTYDITYDKTQPVPSDDSLADRLYQAGVELLTRVGGYSLDTNRRVLFTHEEIKKAAKAAPKQLILGQGKDACTLKHRQPESKIPPTIFGGSVGVLLSEDLYTPFSLSYLQEEIIDVYVCATPVAIHKKRYRTGSAMEVYVAQKEIEWIKEAATKAGRPNISIIGPGSAATAPATIASCFYKGELRKNDSKNVPILNELKISYDALEIATAFPGLIPTRAFYSPLIGGYCGGPEGAAIVGVAGVILAYLCFGSSFTTMDPHHIRYPGSTYRSGIWVASIAGQAVSRNSNFLLANNLFTAAGPCTDMILSEISAATLATVCSGLSMGPSVGAANTKHQDYCSGLETRFMAEVAHATTKARIKREDANELALYFLKQYEANIMEAPLGKKFQECYHLKTIKPTKDWITKYKHAKNQLKELGISLEETTNPQW